MKSRSKRNIERDELNSNRNLNVEQDKQQLDLEEQEKKINALTNLLSNKEIEKEQNSFFDIKSNSSLPKETLLAIPTQININDEEKNNEKNNESSNLANKQTGQSQSKRRVSFKVTQNADSKQSSNNNYYSNLAIRVSQNIILSEEDMKHIEKLSSKQIASYQQLSKSHLEEDPLKVQANSEKLKQLLSQPSELRSDETCKKIAKEIQKIPFLKKYKDIPEFIDICRNLYIKQYEKRQFVFKQGEYGDAFYIILYGSVTIYIDEPTEYKSFMQLKEVAKLEQGDTFGEIALIYDSQRTATVIANEKTYLVVLEKNIFQSYIKEIKNQHLSNQIDFLQQIDFFKNLKQSILIELTTKLQTRDYTSHEIIAHEGEQLSQIIFVKSGRVKVYRSINFRVNRYSSQRIKGDFKDPSPEEIGKKQYMNDMIEIDELSDYSVIGDYSLLYNKPLDYTIITVIPTEVYYISSYDIVKIIPPEFLEKHRKNLKKYPNNVEIRKMYWEKREWESFQQKVISNILIEKENRKGFEKSLKKPTQKFQSIHIPINVMDIQASDNTVYLEFLSNKVPRGLQTKKVINGLKPIQNSISLPNSSTASQLWERLKEEDGIEPPTSPLKSPQQKDLLSKTKYQNIGSSLPNLKSDQVHQNKSIFRKSPQTTRYQKYY
ncbi:hypothetical protein ABPG72_000198 [Tetrahymena utriculariae]